MFGFIGAFINGLNIWNSYCIPPNIPELGCGLEPKIDWFESERIIK
jgi:hypothetical protein